jgi:hypothetical protein
MAADEILTAPQFRAPVIKPFVPLPPEPPYVPSTSVSLAGLLSRLDAGPARLTALLQAALSPDATPFTAAHFTGMRPATHVRPGVPAANELPSLLAFLINGGA